MILVAAVKAQVVAVAVAVAAAAAAAAAAVEAEVRVKVLVVAAVVAHPAVVIWMPMEFCWLFILQHASSS